MKTSLTTEQRINLTKLCNALESGKYPQGQGALLKNDSFCCLGLACEISNLGWWSLLNATDDTGPIMYNVGDNQEMATLHNLSTVQWHYGISDQFELQPHLAINEQELIDMNDAGKSFIEIAAYIREQMKEN